MPASAVAPRLSAPRVGRALGVTVVVLAWIPAVLLLDRGASLWQQDLLGLGTWVLLLGLLARETPLVRSQVAVVVAFATAVEYTFSPLLHVYVYRLHNVPAFVPPGHGLVYLAALAFGRSRLVERWRGPLVAAVVGTGAAYAAWGLWWSGRPDELGAFWFLCMLGFLAWGPSRSLYVGAFIVVTYLEILGTHLGTWTWSTLGPTGTVLIGNPPSGAAGGYGWFDLAALLAGPAVSRAAGGASDRVRDWHVAQRVRALWSSARPAVGAGRARLTAGEAGPVDSVCSADRDPTLHPAHPAHPPNLARPAHPAHPPHLAHPAHPAHSPRLARAPSPSATAAQAEPG